MYLPAHFQAKEDGDILKVISGGGAVDLISNFSGKLNVSTLPMLHRPLPSANGNSMGTLVGHLAKANPQLRDSELAMSSFGSYLRFVLLQLGKWEETLGTTTLRLPLPTWPVRFANWPQAAEISEPRVSLMVALTPFLARTS